MKITMESTPELLEVDGVPVRLWAGKTEGGIEVVVMVHRIAVRTEDADGAFARELQETAQPRQVVVDYLEAVLFKNPKHGRA